MIAMPKQPRIPPHRIVVESSDVEFLSKLWEFIGRCQVEPNSTRVMVVDGEEVIVDTGEANQGSQL